MNQAQKEFLDEVGLGILLALLWDLALLTLLIIESTPTKLMLSAAAGGITVLFAVGVGIRWHYLGQRVGASANRLKNRPKRPGRR